MTKDARERFTLRVPESLFAEIKIKAKKQGVSVNALILQILWDWVNDQASAFMNLRRTRGSGHMNPEGFKERQRRWI